MKKNIFLCIMAYFALGLFSCQNEENLSNEPSPGNSVTESTGSKESYYVNKMAELLNKAIQDPSILEILQEEAKKQIDGDYDILLAQALAISSTRNRTNLLTAVANQISGGQPSSIEEFMTLVDGFKRDVPLLHIYMPDDQDFSKNDFLTVILHPDFDDSKDTIVKAFNKKGEIIELSTKEEPETPFMVVGINERISLFTNRSSFSKINSQLPFFTTTYHSYYLPEAYDYTAPAVPMFSRTSKRDKNDRNSYEVITRAKFASRNAIRDVESWVRGKPEVECQVYFHNKGSLKDFILGESTSISVIMGEDNWYTGKRRKPNPCDNYGNWFVVRWVPLAKTTKMKYIFAERDNGFKIKVFNDLSFKIEGGDEIGSQYVFWEDNINTTYPVARSQENMFEFEVGQKQY
ncbi:hypothetical protein [Bacteroides neonati]|uniref:hypothetical protein n=1 Tax=Bacteroides neonati TaxID=1347393 RepID=UPI0004B91DB9|nr:hypothetical protein [Bacteroides neonati]